MKRPYRLARGSLRVSGTTSGAGHPPAREGLVVSVSETAESKANSAQGALAIAAALLLGMAAVLTAWSAYRESLTSDLVLKNYSEQQAILSLANDAYIRSGQERQQEISLFVETALAAVASSEDDTTAVDYLTQAIMSEELRAAFEWWRDEPEATTPSDALRP